MHNANDCLSCKLLRAAIPHGKEGVTEGEASRVLFPGASGLMTAMAARVLQRHGWRELPHPLWERDEGARFAPPVEMEGGGQVRQGQGSGEEVSGGGG